MPTPIEQLLSRTVYATDGITVNWDFSFASGYLDAAHVKAQTKDASGAITQVTVTPGMLIGEFQLQITPALASGLTLTIYRDTPKNAPLVDFNDESGFSEIALDTNAKQAVMVAAEAIDTINSSDLTAAIESAESAGAAAAAASASASLAAASAASIGTAVTDAEAAADAALAAAASINPANFATAAQGAKADSAVQPAGLVVSAIADASALGRSLMTVVDATAARLLLGLTAFGSSLIQAADAAAARAVLGLGALATKAVVATADIANSAVTLAKLASDVPLYGVGQTWQNMTGVGGRALGAPITNNSGKPIQVAVKVANVSAMVVGITVGGELIQDNGQASLNYIWLTATVPNNTTYSVDAISGSMTIAYWKELRT